MHQTYTLARKLIKTKLYGVLATQLTKIPGYPFGSFAQYCIDNNGDIILFMSTIAQHTRNINKDNKVSLTIVDDINQEDAQATPRATILGNISNCDDDLSAQELYQQFFPRTVEYHKTHNFNFYRLHIENVYYIGGFGDINWIKRKDFNLQLAYSSNEIKAVLQHMNQDHQSAMQVYWDESTPDTHIIQMLMFDGEGMWLKSSSSTKYILFNYPVTDTTMLRKVLIEMVGVAS